MKKEKNFAVDTENAENTEFYRILLLTEKVKNSRIVLEKLNKKKS